MLAIAKNAEENLLKQVRSLADSNPTCRCLYLRSSQIADDVKSWLYPFLQTMDDALIAESAQAYICHDGEIFITARSLTHKILGKLLEQLGLRIKKQIPAGFADLYEIAIDRERIETLAARKLERRRAEEQAAARKKKEALQAVTREKALESIENSVLSSLSARRAARETPEILVVEDDAFSQRLITNAIGAKYGVTLTADGQGALLSYAAKAPDVVFLDIGLPDIDGLTVLERLFKIDPDAYVVMFSGNGSKENIMRAVELGARGFVGKPFTKEKLFQYISKSPFIQAKQPKEPAHGHSV